MFLCFCPCATDSTLTVSRRRICAADAVPSQQSLADRSRQPQTWIYIYNIAFMLRALLSGSFRQTLPQQTRCMLRTFASDTLDSANVRLRHAACCARSPQTYWTVRTFASDTLHVVNVRLSHAACCERSPQTYGCRSRTFSSDTLRTFSSDKWLHVANVRLRHVRRCERSLQIRCTLRTFASDTFANILLRQVGCRECSP